MVDTTKMKLISSILLVSDDSVTWDTERRTLWRKLSKLAKIDFQTAFYGNLFRILKNRQFICNQRIKLYQKKCREQNFEAKSWKGVTLMSTDAKTE